MVLTRKTIRPLIPSERLAMTVIEGKNGLHQRKSKEEDARMPASSSRCEEPDAKKDDENEEGRRPKIKRGPKEPTREEIREHERTHTPYRSWCLECVKARGKATDHHVAEHEERGWRQYILIIGSCEVGEGKIHRRLRL